MIKRKVKYFLIVNTLLFCLLNNTSIFDFPDNHENLFLRDLVITYWKKKKENCFLPQVIIIQGSLKLAHIFMGNAIKFKGSQPGQPTFSEREASTAVPLPPALLQPHHYATPPWLVMSLQSSCLVELGAPWIIHVAVVAEAASQTLRQPNIHSSPSPLQWIQSAVTLATSFALKEKGWGFIL